jgi:hypothetical protein
VFERGSDADSCDESCVSTLYSYESEWGRQ